MKVYVLEAGGCNDGDHRIEGVFSTEEKAKEAETILKVDGYIYDIELDEFIVVDWTQPAGSKRYETRKV
jgi:hypothetical protein